MSSGKALLGVLAGMAAGAALGLLFAPESGSKMRRRMVRKGEDLVDSWEGLSDSVNARVEEKFDSLVDAISGKVQKVKS